MSENLMRQGFFTIILVLLFFLNMNNCYSQEKIVYSFGDYLNVEVDSAIKKYTSLFGANQSLVEVCIFLQKIDTVSILTITSYDAGIKKHIGKSNRVYINDSKNEIQIFFEYDNEFGLINDPKSKFSILRLSFNGYHLILDKNNKVINRYFSQ